jgi:beta-lactamase regulating signal transducer with metallopeptidase domain
MTGIGQSSFLQALGWAVLNSLWQMALLWVVYQLITGIFKKAGPSHKSMLASGLLMAGFAWFVFTFCSILSNEASREGIVSSGLVNLEGNPQLNDWLQQTLPVASLLYLVLLILPVLHFIRNYRFVRVIRQYGISKADVQWRMFVRKVAAQMGIKKPVHIWVSELVTSPVTIGYLKPVILVPMAAINHLSTTQLEAVLLHELAHIRRYDYFINLIIKFIQTILYYNPFATAFVKIVEREREKSCDEMVMQFQYDPHGYASALLVLERSNHLPKPLAVAASGKKNDLLHRIEWIMGVKKKPVVSFNKLTGLFAGLLCVIFLNAVIILSKPMKNEQPYATFSPMASPLYFFTGDEQGNGPAVSPSEPAMASIHTGVAIANNKEAERKNIEAKESEARYAKLSPEERIHALINPFAIAAASIEMPEVPALNRFQEAQVKEAINASRKVLQEGQWKEVEKNIGEVFTELQKEQLKLEYQQQMSKLDMKKWERNLYKAYDKVDWERVNVELSNAISMIRLDSVRHVYLKALENICVVQSELKENNLTAIPDSDITLKEVELQKVEVQKAINKLKTVRDKKIIHL